MTGLVRIWFKYSDLTSLGIMTEGLDFDPFISCDKFALCSSSEQNDIEVLQLNLSATPISAKSLAQARCAQIVNSNHLASHIAHKASFGHLRVTYLIFSCRKNDQR
jgi:hypothetical protein